MAAATQLEILDLRHFAASQLRPLLEDEARAWETRLTWDYQTSAQLLLQYLDSRILPGFVALDRGRVCGFTFCVYEGTKAVIGDVYAIPSPSGDALHVTKTLLRHLIEVLEHSPDVDRIESQLLLYDSGEIRPAFVDSGFHIHPRLFMHWSPNGHGLLPSGALDGQAAQGFPSFIEVAMWTPAHYQAAAELIQASYVGHIDSRINDQYRSLAGSLRFLHNIVRFPGCGIFEPGSSWTLRDKRTGALVGIVLCSRIAPQVAHITQLCVTPQYRSHGLGQSLLRHCATHLVGRGFRSITLTVTEENLQAVRLYEELGFSLRHRFDAMVLDKNVKS